MTMESQVLTNLRDAAEEWVDGWGTVYLDNVERAGLSPRAFAGHLSALEATGLYKSHDKVFGFVRAP